MPRSSAASSWGTLLVLPSLVARTMTRILLIVLAALAVGCAGKAMTESAGASGGAAAGAGGAAAGCHTAQCPPLACAGSEVTLPGRCCPICLPPTVDAGCVDVSACSLTPADVACNDNTDCKLFSVPGCCGHSVIGVNQSSFPRCGIPACPPGVRCGSAAAGVPFESCGVWTPPDSGGDNSLSLAVTCLDHECTSIVDCSICVK